ncbi:MAG: ferredoxin, 2Fe-2S type, system [Chthonomonadaceae bacterium]|nr:ferredoxin, 2Fe-2S type, system [Chthonomonadaceae bacterium]
MNKRPQPDASPVRLTFLPDGFTITASPGDTILDVALEHGVGLEHECGGNCACTTCHVYVLDGEERLSPPEEVEIDRLSTDERLEANSRLGCQAILQGGDVTVQIVPIPLTMET